LTKDISTSPETKMSPFNLAIVITLTLLHHPHDPHLDASLSNPHKQGGASLLIIHILQNHLEIFPEKDLPPPPMPPRPTSTPIESTRPSPTQFLSNHTLKRKSSVRLISSSSADSCISESTPTTSPLPSAEFGSSNPVKGKGRIPGVVGSGVVEELRRVYEERCRIVRSQEPGRKETLVKNGIGIGRVG
jgi:hypothetical protein